MGGIPQRLSLRVCGAEPDPRRPSPFADLRARPEFVAPNINIFLLPLAGAIETGVCVAVGGVLGWVWGRLLNVMCPFLPSHGHETLPIVLLTCLVAFTVVFMVTIGLMAAASFTRPMPPWAILVRGIFGEGGFVTAFWAGILLPELGAQARPTYDAPGIIIGYCVVLVLAVCFGITLREESGGCRVVLVPAGPAVSAGTEESNRVYYPIGKGVRAKESEVRFRYSARTVLELLEAGDWETLEAIKETTCGLSFLRLSTCPGRADLPAYLRLGDGSPHSSQPTLRDVRLSPEEASWLLDRIPSLIRDGSESCSTEGFSRTR